MGIDRNRAWRRAALGLALLLAAGAAHAQALHAGERVRVWVSGGTYAGTVREVGTGDHAGQYLIHFDDFTTEQYALARNVTPLRAAAPAPRANPRRGSNGCRIMVLNGLPVCDPGSVRRR